MSVEEQAAETMSSWQSWCRLCAKRSENGQENSLIFSEEIDPGLTTSIGKYFWVNIKPEDEVPKSLCRECHHLIEELVGFTERINKVQAMYCILQNLKHTTVEAANKLRSQFGVSDEGWEHILKSNVAHTPKLDVVNREVQTDLVIFFNNTSSSEETASSPKDILAQEKIVEHIDQEQEQTYEYILNDDNEEGVIASIHYKINTVDGEVDEDMDVEVSDLFKDLKFKGRDNELSENKNELNIKEEEEKEEEEAEEEGNCEAIENSDNDTTELLTEEVDETVEDDEDFIEILAHHNAVEGLGEYDTLKSRKRGRPSNSTNQGENSSGRTYRYYCSTCKRKYKNPTVYRKHMLNQHGVVVGQLPAFECSFCNTDCLNESSLKKHMRKHLPDDEKYTVPCKYCEKMFSNESAMRQHVNGIHHQIKPFICDQCGRGCKTLAALNEHLLVHTNECPFICEVCKKGFKNKSRLKSHMDTHTESEYTCPECNLKLNTRRTLRQHRLVHSNVKRFKCEFCDAAFKRSKAFKNHLILHTGLRPYKCPFCEKSFSNGSNCRSHKKRAHPKELAEEEALGKKSEPTCMPKLEDLKAPKAIVHPRKLRRRTTANAMTMDERRKRELGDDADDLSVEEINENEDIHYEIEEDLEDEDVTNGECQEFVNDGEETVIYEIIGEV